MQFIRPFPFFVEVGLACETSVDNNRAVNNVMVQDGWLDIANNACFIRSTSDLLCIFHSSCRLISRLQSARRMEYAKKRSEVDLV